MMDIGKIIRKMASGFHPAAYLFIPVIKIKDRAGGAPMHQMMERCVDRYTDPEQRENKAWLRRLKRDMWYSFLLYHVEFEEYFLFRFPRLSHEGRREFIPIEEKNELSIPLSSEEVQARIWDKWEAYKLFQPYYRRDAIAVDGTSNYEDFAQFVKKHPRFIAKPRLTSCGDGVTVIDTAEQADIPALYERLSRDGYTCEEIIRQAAPLSDLHPESVNTVRIATFVKNGTPSVLFANLRIGCGGSIVDNVGAGGFVASIDLDTGVVQTPGIMNTLERAIFHPDTGVQILGLHIPRWAELQAMVMEAAMSYSVHPYISWDCAYSVDGWVVVEANCRGQMTGAQFTTEHGLRSRMSQFFDM